MGGIYIQSWRQAPICLREGRVNSITRISFEQRLAKVLRQLPPNSMLLMYTSDHVGALQQAGVALRRVVTENNYHLWQNALKDPAGAADFVVAMHGDPVWQATQQHSQKLQRVADISVSGQPVAVVYKSTASFR